MKLEKKLNVKLDNVIINNINVNDYVTKDEYNAKVEELNKDIEDLESKVIDWSELGYDEQPESLNKDIEYAKSIKENWNPDDVSIKFERDADLVYFPTVDFSKRGDISYMFYYCTKLKHIGKINKSQSSPNTNYAFAECSSLHTIEEIEMGYSSIGFTMFQETKNIVNITFKNLGKLFYSTTFYLNNLQNWSYDTMIDSLLNYSYDRTNQSDIITIELHSDAKARLTDADIAAITLKGYTIA